MTDLLSKLEWEDETYTLSEIARKFDSALIVRLVSGEGGHDSDEESRVDLGPGVDSTRPFLVFSRRRRTRIYAENLVWNAKNKLYTPSGPLLEIPKDYMGWFEILPETSEDPPVEHYSSIDTLSRSNANYFLLTTPAAGFLGNQTEDGVLKLDAELHLYPGEILKKHQVITKTWVVNEAAGSSKKPAQTHLLRCTDRTKRDIYIPLAHPGNFCAVADEGNNEKNVVYQVGALATQTFPLLVKLVWGWAPFQSCPDFSGLLRLLGFSRFDTLVLHNIQDRGNMLQEIPVDMDVRVQKAKHHGVYANSDAFQKLIQWCCRDVVSFLTSIKAVSVQYNRQSSDTGQESEEHHPTGRLAEATDMSSFDPAKIFPPQTERIKVSGSWSLSFRDPEHLYDETKNVIDENSIWLESGEDQQTSGQIGKSPRRGKSVSGHGSSLAVSFTQLPPSTRPGKGSGTGGLPRLERSLDTRASRQQEMAAREARC